ncbi:MFS transporter [Actinospica durhamensis]|uniref:MFS transporter n=1 Tax=Actinospica durhamensis TaxID=1508375 RepID=A0A941EZX7_9ACTN|nr:MFS transporter [Actinospica durhamensis]MBR7837499.1 MFS transporter [Actinospica durhamensis]
MSTPSGAPTPGTPSSSTPSYYQVLRLPGAARLFGFALWARLSYGTIFLSLTLALIRATGSYATTGACIAIFGLASALSVPVRAALIDRHGMRRALRPMAVVYASLLALITVTIATMHSAGVTRLPHSTVFLLFALCTAAGATAPPLGPSMRTLWAELATDPDMRRRAFALDTVCEEALYLVGPLLAGALATWGAAAAGVAVSAVLVLTGTLAMVSALPPQSRDNADAGAQTAAAGAELDTRVRPQPTYRRARLRVDVLGGAVPASLATGISLSVLGLLIVAFAQHHHQLTVVAWAEAGMSAGSACGGLAFGALKWRASNRLQMCSLLALIGIVIAAAGSAQSMAVLILLACALGLFVSPTITMTYVVADEAAPADQRIRAGGLVNGAYNLGSATGSAVAGLLLGGLALRSCFLLAATPALAAALMTGVRTWRKSESTPSATAQAQDAAV